MQLESLLQYLDLYLGTAEHPDYPSAWNGLQVQGPEEVAHIVTGMQDAEVDTLADLLAEIDKRIERARCLGRSSLASRATGDRGF